jgi:hypothetical protein
VADRAVAGNGAAGAIMALGAVALPPGRSVGTRRRLAVAPDAVVLTVAGKAPFAIAFGHEAVAPGPPKVRVVTRHDHRVARDAVPALMTDETCRRRPSHTASTRPDGPAVIFAPVPPVRAGLRVGDPFILVSCRCSRGYHYRDDCSGGGQEKENRSLLTVMPVRNHSASPAERSDNVRYCFRIRTFRSPRNLS